MLRALVLLLLVVNAGLWYWLHDDPQALQSDREPQRLNHQVSPDAVQVLPDLPGASAPRGAASAASAGAAAASGPDVALAAAVPPAASATGAVAGTAVACSETPPLSDAEFATLKTALGKAGLPDAAIGERRQTKGGAWIVYLGRFADAGALQQKSAELRKLELKFDHVNAPTALAPGLSLGQFTSQDEAARKLAELSKRGVHGARVAVLDAPIVLRHLQVHAGDAAWRRAAIGQRFDGCPADAPSNT
ncbi:MAG TPA: hypothetical protein VES00_08385 [Burkholderiaceae bacterium]|jgi:hypothetical protein|nr:hypothetical protein [Burkholderiaceae bacterium]